MTSHLARKIENFQHRRAFADDAVEFQVLQKLFFQGTYAAALIIQRSHIIERAL